MTSPVNWACCAPVNWMVSPGFLFKELKSRNRTKASIVIQGSRLLLNESPVTGREGVGLLRPAMQEPILPTNYKKPKPNLRGSRTLSGDTCCEDPAFRISSAMAPKFLQHNLCSCSSAKFAMQEWGCQHSTPSAP